MAKISKLSAKTGRSVLAAAGLAGASLVAMSLSAQIATAQPVAVQAPPPPLTQTEVPPSPIHAIPDSPAEAPDGASALADSLATGARSPGASTRGASTLNAQMAALRRSAVDAQMLRAADQPPAQAAPTVAIARRVMDAAAAFDSYMHRASAISPDPHEGADVAKAVMAGAAYEPHQFQEGAIAYAALAALQDARFVQGVSDLGQDPVVRRELVRRLLDKPETALQLPAAREAGALVVSVIGRLGDSVISSGAAVKQASYTVQQQAWSKAPIDGAEALLASVKTQSATKVVLAPADAPALITNVMAAGKIGRASQAGSLAPTATVAHGLALAALAVLGAAGDEAADQLTPVLSEAANAQCLKMAKLNLNQCLAVAGPHYEGMFCLGRHGLMETGQCVVSAVGWTAPAPPLLTPPSRSILVPIALASLGGPERDSVMDGRAAVMPPPPAAPDAAPPTPVDYAPVSPSTAAPPPRPMARDAYAMALPQAPVAQLAAPSRWRPNGPQPGDSFVGGPYGAQATAVAPATLAYEDAAAVPSPPPAYGYGYGPPTD